MPKKKGNETIFSSQEATQLIFMDSDSEGDEAGHIIRSTQYCEECPEKPGSCLGECFRIYHTKIDYTK